MMRIVCVTVWATKVLGSSGNLAESCFARSPRGEYDVFSGLGLPSPEYEC